MNWRSIQKHLDHKKKTVKFESKGIFIQHIAYETDMFKTVSIFFQVSLY